MKLTGKDYQNIANQIEVGTGYIKYVKGEEILYGGFAASVSPSAPPVPPPNRSVPVRRASATAEASHPVRCPPPRPCPPRSLGSRCKPSRATCGLAVQMQFFPSFFALYNHKTLFGGKTKQILRRINKYNVKNGLR